MADSNSIGTDVGVNLNAVTANGNGPALKVGRDTIEVSVWASSTGAPTAANVTLDFASDGVGTTWYSLPTVVAALPTGITAAVGTVTVPSGVTHVRSVLSGLTGGASPTVTSRLSYRARS
jgi:hypothetical protein